MFRSGSFLFLVLFVFGCHFTYAQQQEQWQSALASKVNKIIYAGNEQANNIDSQYLPSLQRACRNFRILEGPECRCLPNVEAQVIFVLEHSGVLIVQLVPNHWFQAVLCQENRVVHFFLKDEQNTFYQTVEQIMNPSSSTPPQSSATRETMCRECNGKMYAMAIGKCTNCGAATSSIAFKYCRRCAQQKNACQACGKSLK